MTYLTAARITLSRAKGWRMPENTVKVDRSTCYGNPWCTGNPGQLHLRTMPSGYHARLPIDQASAVEAFRLWMTEKPAWWMLPPPDYFTIEGWQSLWAALNFQRNAIMISLPELRGKNLACWCKPGCACHADVLLEIANA
jgi:Domain of unknown function (DUF4326)